MVSSNFIYLALKYSKFEETFVAFIINLLTLNFVLAKISEHFHIKDLDKTALPHIYANNYTNKDISMDRSKGKWDQYTMYKDTESWIEQCGRCLRRKMPTNLECTDHYLSVCLFVPFLLAIVLSVLL